MLFLNGSLESVDGIASVRHLADLKSKEVLERHNADPQELPWFSNSLLYSEDPTIELDTEVTNGRTNIVPEITEEAFRDILKKKQADAAALKQAKRVK